jgi:CubicO group peptidase (beta-lactamase class C family)
MRIPAGLLALVWSSFASPALACAVQPVPILGDGAAGPVRPQFYAALDPAIADDFSGEVQLYRHGSPQDANGVPDFYSTGPSGVEWCLAGRSAPPDEGWSYNYCEYIVLGAVLELVTGRPIGTLIGERLRAAGVQGPMLATRRPRSLARSGADFPFDISRYGASAGIVGSVNDIIAFDRALLDEDFEFGELWQKQGWSFDTLSAAVCGDAT